MTRDFSAFHRNAGWRRLFSSIAALALGWGFALSAAADNVKVLAVDAFTPVVAAMAPVFEKRTGHKLVVVKDSSSALAKRIREGEEFDLAVLPPALLESLGEEGAVSDGSIIPLARQDATVFAGAVSTSAADSRAALSLLILLASEDTQAILAGKGLSAP